MPLLASGKVVRSTKGAETAGLGRFREWTGLLPEGYGLLTQAGCIEGLRKKGS